MRRAATVLLGLASIGLLILIVVRVANYDGRSPMEKLEAEVADASGEPLPRSCPRVAPPEGGLADRHDDSADVMVPEGQTELLLCRYYSFEGIETPRTAARAGKLAGEANLRRLSLVEAIARQFNELQLLPEGAAYSCPAGDMEPLSAFFRYPDGPPVPVEVELGGCGFASNGSGPYAFTSSKLTRRLGRLTSRAGDGHRKRRA